MYFLSKVCLLQSVGDHLKMPNQHHLNRQLIFRKCCVYSFKHGVNQLFSTHGKRISQHELVTPNACKDECC